MESGMVRNPEGVTVAGFTVLTAVMLSPISLEEVTLTVRDTAVFQLVTVKIWLVVVPRSATRFPSQNR